MNPTEKINELRHRMKAYDLAAWIVPSNDPHQSEYPAEHWKMRAWLTGFHGSAGTLVVTPQLAGLWVDPRYHIRAEQDLLGTGIQVFKYGLPGVPTYQQWLGQELPHGALIGFDGTLFSAAAVASLRRACAHKALKFLVDQDLPGQIWQDRPKIPVNPAWTYDLNFAGETCSSKIARIRATLKSQAAQAQLICSLDDIAWTLNMRGSDVPYNPVVVSYLWISQQEIRLFIQPEKMSPELRQILAEDGVTFAEYSELQQFLRQLTADQIVLCDPEKTSVQFQQLLSGVCTVRDFPSIPALLKAIKNRVEIDGLKAANLRDGLALVRWLFWLEHFDWESPQTEITLADRLSEFRQSNQHFQGLSFGTICGYQANSAVGHYSPQPETTPRVFPQGILLIDSGAQYLDGTTDITRTLSLSEPTPEQKNVFTHVLKSHIRLAQAIFPRGTTGGELDAIARDNLWRQGWECRHGIGHGVGHFLNVHEGPASFRRDNRVVLQPGMLLSNEPGVYFEGSFGVRLENLLLTVCAETTRFGEFLAFETVSLCPFDLTLLDVSLLQPAEITWLNQYHQRVYACLSPFLTKVEQAWLFQKTRQI